MVEDLRNNLSACLEYSSLDLVSRRSWRNIRFDEITQVLGQLYSTCDDLLNSPIEDLTSSTNRTLDDLLRHVMDQLAKINSFRPESAGERTEVIRDKIANDALIVINKFLDNARPWVAYLITQRINAPKRLGALEDKAERNSKEFDDYFRSKKDEFDRLSSDAREIFGAHGLTLFAGSFDAEAEHQSSSARGWPGVTAPLFALTFTASCLVFYSATDSGTRSGIDGSLLTLARGVPLILVLLTIALWSGKTYRALKHQAAVNRHRFLSIKTFQTFMSAAVDQNIKDAVLLEATKTVFSHTATGYLASGQEGTSTDSRAIEILRSSQPARSSPTDS